MRSHNTPTRSLVALGLVTILVVGCTLSPDDSPLNVSLVVHVEAVIDDAGKSMQVDFVDDIEYLSGRARIWSLPNGCNDVCDEACLAMGQLIGSGVLTVALDETIDPVGIVMEGNLDFELDTPGSLYRLDVDLLERGRRVEGVYEGDIDLDSGLGAQVELLRLSDLIGDDFTIDVLEFCMNSDLVELDPEDRCIEPDDISGTWNPDLNQLVFAYTRSDIEVEGADGDSLLVRLNAALQPALIYTGCTEIGNVASGGGSVDVSITLAPQDDPPSGPGHVGEELAGVLVISLYTDDGALELSEEGRVTVARTEELDTP